MTSYELEDYDIKSLEARAKFLIIMKVPMYVYGLYFTKPLEDRIAELEKRIEELEKKEEQQ